VRLNRAGLERCLGLEASEDRAALIEDFSIQWRRHSREGGLAESLARMQVEPKTPLARHRYTNRTP